MWLLIGHVCDLHGSLNSLAFYNSLLSFILLLQEETETYISPTLNFFLLNINKITLQILPESILPFFY